MIHVSRHAAKRYRERVCQCSNADARAAILSHGRALELAVAIGAKIVRLGDGSRLLLDGSTVVTVFAKGMASRDAA